MTDFPLVVVVGPTASGKSSLAMRIAEKYDGEIIAADSRTVYRGMDIGTAKPTAEDRRRIKHHLLDVVDPGQPFSAAEFKRLAQRAIDDVHTRGKLPILVGGTGLYIDALLFDYQFNAPADPELREQLQSLSIEQLQALCRQKNINLPANSQNKRHLIRVIETDGKVSRRNTLRLNTLVVGITAKREELRDRIERRVLQMVHNGVISEVATIGEQYQWSEATKGGVYMTFRGVSDGTKSLDRAIQDTIQSDMGLAKRQMTWLKRHTHIVWSEDPDVLLSKVDTFLHQYV